MNPGVDMTSDRAQAGADRKVGRRFGDYVLEKLVGRGGMGVVFQARHAVTGQLVAVKLMAPDLADNPSFRERFILEAEAGPSLDHPNIVTVFESGSAEGELFIAMELIEGTDLKGLIQQEGRLDPQRALSILRQAASALDAAHESGIVHRDVKPQNILVVPRESPQGRDRVYLTDFGLVRPVASESSASRTGQVFGSVAYMAPELIEEIPVDGRADVYALGCVLFESLTGKVPFDRNNEISAVWAHIHEDPPLLTDTCPGLPGGLNDVVLKAMAKHPDDRYLTAGEFVAELELGLGRKLSHLKYAHVRPLVARIPRRKTEREVWAPNFFPELSRVRAASRERLDWRKAGAWVAAALLLSTVQVGRDGGLPTAIADVAEAAGSTGQKIVQSAFGGPDPSDDGSRQPPSRQRDRATNKTQAADLKQGPARSTPGAVPGGLGSKSRTVVPLPATAAAGGGAGELIAFHRFTGCMHYSKCAEIYTVREDGTGLVNLTPGPLYGAGPRWSPDGEKILFTGWDRNTQSSNLWVTDVWVMNADGTGLTNLTQTLHVSEAAGSWSPDGERIAFVKRSGDVGVWAMDADGANQRQLTSNRSGDLLPDWSPDGRKIVFQRRVGCPAVGDCSDGSDPEIWAVDVGNGNVSRLGSGAAPQWSPDGRKIVFDRDSGTASGSDIYVIDADGSNPARLIASQRYEVSPSWRPDGRALIFQYEGVLSTLSLRSGVIRQITDVRTCDAPSWQPRPVTS